MDDALLKKWQELAIDFTKFARDKGFTLEDVFMADMILISAFCVMKKIPDDDLLELLDIFRDFFEKIEGEINDT
jgi:hypothetical protein